MFNITESADLYQLLVDYITRSMEHPLNTSFLSPGGSNSQAAALQTDPRELIGVSNMNMSQLLSVLKQLTQSDIDRLYEQLYLNENEDVSNKADNRGDMSSELMQYEEYRIHKCLLLYVPPILIILGTFGNIFSFIILKRKAMLKFSTYYYLMVLAVADTLVLYIGLLPLWIGELTGFDIRDQADWLCKITNVIGYTVSDFSVWLIIAVTTERFIVVCYPLKANSMCNSMRAKKVIIGLLIGLILLNLHFCWTVEIREFTHRGESYLRCAGNENHQVLVDKVWPWVDAFIYSFLPFIAIMALNGLIIRQVILARRSRSHLAEATSRGYEQRRPSHEGSTRLTVMLLTISFAFLLTTLPMNVTSIAAEFWNHYNKDLKRVSKFTLARTVTELLMYVNHSMNFFLYCATGQKFRHQLIWMVCYAKRTYNLPWGSDQGSGGTNLDTMQRNMLKSRRNVDGNDMFATVRSDMYTPLKLNGIVKEAEGYL